MDIMRTAGKNACSGPKKQTEGFLWETGGRAMIYLDHAATTPMAGQVAASMQPYFAGDYGNASTIYEFGEKSREGGGACKGNRCTFAACAA